MRKIGVSSDSTCDLTLDIIQREDIPIVPLHVLLKDNEYKDGIDITPSEIFDFVKEHNILPKTSATSVFEFEEFFTKALNKYECLLHFDISSEISSTYQNALLAAEKFEGKVKVIDSRNLSTGISCLILKAIDLINDGKSFDEVYEYCLKKKEEVQTSFVIDTVDYLYKGGRCSSAALVATKLLGIHPMINMKNGKLVAEKKYRGSLKKCFEKYVFDLKEMYPNYDKRRVFITHSSCEDKLVNYVKELLEKNFEFEEIIPTVAGSVITSHCGKNTLGVLFLK